MNAKTILNKQTTIYDGIFKRFLSDKAVTTKKKYINVEKFGTITSIGINRPGKRNCLSSDTILQLRGALNQFEEDADARVAILHGEGGNFCAGLDLTEVAERGCDAILDALDGFSARELCKKPVIAAVNGYAAAEGFELSLACDLRVIEDTAQMGALGRRFGAPMLLCGAGRLACMVGTARALDLTLTGRLITGVEADSWGLASRAVSTGTAIGQAFSLAGCVAKYDQSGLLHDREHINRATVGHSTALTEQDMAALKQKALADLERNIHKFHEGLGRHGKSFYLHEKEKLSWELEDGALEKQSA